MKRITNIFLGIVATLTFMSCNDFLDQKINDNYDEEMFLHSGFNNLKAWGLGAYNYLRPYNGLDGGASLAAACDEADFAKQSNVQKFNTGAWNQFSNPDDVFAHYYKGIRHANLFLEKTEEYKHILYEDTLIASNKDIYLKNCDDFKKLRAEVRLLRAYFYFELIKRYGGVPLVKHSLTLEDDLDLPRNSFDECVNFITDECDVVYKDLTNYWANYQWQDGEGGKGKDNTNLGRLEKPVAKFLKLKALLYAASPLHNPTEDIGKWEKAALAGYDFLTDKNCQHVRYLYSNYNGLFQAQANNDAIVPFAGKNTGIIMTRPFEKAGSTFEKANYPVGMVNGGGACICPSQNLLDAFEYSNGTVFDPSKLKNTDNPYEERDPRLNMIIAINGSTLGKNIDGSARQVQSYMGGADGIGVKYGATTTGYYLRKLLVENFDLSKSESRAKSWVLMRYAEVLLNYAEAVNESIGPDAKVIGTTNLTLSAREAINLVRDRVGMPPIQSGLDKENMRINIQRERQVEMAFEDQRFFDVRRWKIANVTENKPLMGILISTNGGTTTYERFKVENRIFQEKMYLYPIPYNEIAKSKGILIQNSGWE